MHNTKDVAEGSAAPTTGYPSLVAKDRDWQQYPIGTKAHAFNGGYWVRVERGWKWHCGDTFPTPGGDACGKCVELPVNG